MDQRHTESDSKKTSCCQTKTTQPSCCDIQEKKRFDYLLWGSLWGVVVLYALYLFMGSQLDSIGWLNRFAHTVYELMNIMWWGILIGMVMVALLAKIPKEFVISVLGRDGTFGSILRATLAGVLLDLCNHGILMVGAKLYERGASAGQVMAFLVASPWNSFSLTIILFALIGLKWTLAFIVLSMVIAVNTGWVFDLLVKRGVLPANQNTIDLPADFHFWREAKRGLATTRYDKTYFKDLLVSGIQDSRMVLRWILFGVILAGLIRAFIDTGTFQTYFGPTLAGLGLTVLVATILEVCSEGSTPIAADLLTRAKAPGNSFAFLMTGVATDYTEVMVLKDTTRSWKIALFLPLITVPQILVIALVMNLL